MHAIITGATGMVGGIVLQHCLKDDTIKQITSFVRRPSGITHKKLEEIILTDFTDYSGCEEQFMNVDIVYFCLGVYTGQVTDNQFKEITVNYTKVFAELLKKFSPEARFCFLSGSGADQAEKSRVSFARYKGIAENYLISQFANIHIFRPGYIYPVKKRISPNFTYRLIRNFYPLIKLFGSRFSLKSTELGMAFYKTGIQGTNQIVLENIDILKIKTT
jgi:nucleoside-diphosphate-sugar epimerase